MVRHSPNIHAMSTLDSVADLVDVATRTIGRIPQMTCWQCIRNLAVSEVALTTDIAGGRAVLVLQSVPAVPPPMFLPALVRSLQWWILCFWD